MSHIPVKNGFSNLTKEQEVEISEEKTSRMIIKENISERAVVMSYNTPVTLLTNFRLVPGHTVNSIRIPRFQELMFRTRTWMHSQ